jgi:hypothetical protein
MRVWCSQTSGPARFVRDLAAPIRSGTLFLIFFASWLAVLPLAAAPLSKCRLNNQSEYVSPGDRSISEEKRKEVRLRVLVDALDDVDIVFRGRLASRRYLSGRHPDLRPPHP